MSTRGKGCTRTASAHTHTHTTCLRVNVFIYTYIVVSNSCARALAPRYNVKTVYARIGARTVDSLNPSRSFCRRHRTHFSRFSSAVVVCARSRAFRGLRKSYGFFFLINSKTHPRLIFVANASTATIMCIVIHPILRALYGLFTGAPSSSSSSAVRVTVSHPIICILNPSHPHTAEVFSPFSHILVFSAISLVEYISCRTPGVECESGQAPPPARQATRILAAPSRIITTAEAQ